MARRTRNEASQNGRRPSSTKIYTAKMASPMTARQNALLCRVAGTAAPSCRHRSEIELPLSESRKRTTDITSRKPEIMVGMKPGEA